MPRYLYLYFSSWLFLIFPWLPPNQVSKGKNWRQKRTGILFEYFCSNTVQSFILRGFWCNLTSKFLRQLHFSFYANFTPIELEIIKTYKKLQEVKNAPNPHEHYISTGFRAFIFHSEQLLRVICNSGLSDHVDLNLSRIFQGFFDLLGNISRQ